jgi:hypothetical protein
MDSKREAWQFGPEMPGWKRMVAKKTVGKTHIRLSQ